MPAHRWVQQFVPVSAPQSGPHLNFLKMNMWPYCRNDLFLKDLVAHGCNKLSQEREMNRQPVWPEEFPEQSPVRAQLGFQMCSGSSPQQRSVPDSRIELCIIIQIDETQCWNILSHLPLFEGCEGLYAVHNLTGTTMLVFVHRFFPRGRRSVLCSSMFALLLQLSHERSQLFLGSLHDLTVL